MEKTWKLRKEIDKEKIEKLAKEIGIKNHLAEMLIARGIDNYVDAKKFFNPNLGHLHNPFLFNDMQKAVDRLTKAIDNKERILIYGDYDVDGTTSVALVYSFLKEIHSNIDYYIPDRYTEGYGVSFKGVDYAFNSGCTLIIALDCGIKDNSRVDYANYKKIDFIICDHHTPGTDLPKAVAVLDAKRTDNTYPFNELSGCGVGFKFMQALCESKKIPLYKLLHYVDLVAVSVASDIVPIRDENRVLEHIGLKKLNTNPLPAFKALIKEAGIFGKKLEIDDLLFQIGPRINAAGRMKSGKDAVKLLITNNETEAENFAKLISEYNNQRKNNDKNITEAALKILANDPQNSTKKTTVVWGENWHKGVVGIVASRLTETYYRPTIVFTKIDGHLTGSARSVGDFNIYDAINSCNKYLDAFGGHAFAAGLNLKEENYEIFANDFEKYVAQNIKPYQTKPFLEIEQYINLGMIDQKFYNTLKRFEPCGPDNPQPIFATKNVKERGLGNTKKVGKTEPKEHLKLEIIDEFGNTMQGIGFGMAKYCEQIIAPEVSFDVCYRITENEFKGKKTLQLFILDIHINKN